jgi:hypothetical protein
VIVKPAVVVNVLVERIEGNLAIASIPTDKKRGISPEKTLSSRPKKYLILMRKLIPPDVREGLSLEISLRKGYMEKASPDLKQTLEEVSVLNEVMNFIG